MADFTYPDGVSGAVAIAAAGTALTGSSATLGSIGLGDGKPGGDGQKQALGVIFQFDTVVGAGITTFAITFEVTNDGTNWYQIDEYDHTITSGMGDPFRVHLEPFTYGVNAVRVNAYVDGSPLGSPTLTCNARLTGVYEVVGGV